MVSNIRQLPAALLLCALTGVCSAQQAAEHIDEIQVTATRRTASAEDVSAALTIVSGDEIEGNKLTTDALAMQPGVYLQQTTPGQGAAIIRGLKGSEILHLVDGFRLNNAIFRNAPTQYLALVAPGGVERIEIVRGAPTSLYGSDAVGGVVQVISRVPTFEGAETESRGSAYLGADTGERGLLGRLSVEAGNADVAGIASLEYLDNGDRRTGGGNVVEPSAYKSYGGRAALSLTPESGNDWIFDFQFARQPSTPRVDELNAGFGETEPASSEFEFAPNERYFTRIAYKGNDVLWDSDWSVDLGWQRIVDDRISRNFEAPDRRYEHNQSDLYGVLANVSNATDRGSWIVGIELYHDVVSSEREEEDIVSGVRQPVAARFPDGAKLDQFAVYGNMLREVGDRHTFSGGIRFSLVYAELPSSPGTRQNDVSADVGYLFDINSDLSFFVNLGHGFRAPNIFDLGTLGERPGNRFNIPNPDLQSERVTQLDTGLRQRGDNWDATLTIYGLRYEDRITSVSTGAVTPDGRDIVQSQNIKSAEIYGAEVSFSSYFGESMSTSLVLNYSRGEQTESDGTSVPADRIPPLNGRAAFRYDGGDDWYLETYLQFASQQSRLSPRDVRDPRIDPNGTAGWGTLNFTANWQVRDAVRLGVSLLNVFDRGYRTHGSGINSVGRSLGVNAQFIW